MRTRYSFSVVISLMISLFIPAFVTAPVRCFAEEASPSEQSTTAPEQAQKTDRPAGDVIQKGEMLILVRAIDIALKKNPSKLAAQNTVEASRSRVGGARANYYPQLSASGGFNRTNPIPATPTARDRYNQYTTSVTLSQNIFDFGKTSSSVDVAKFNLESSRSDLDTTTDQIIFNVKQAYYGMLQAKRNREAEEDIVKQLQVHLDQAKGFYQVGVRAKIDVTKAEVDFSNGKLNLIKANNALRIARVTLNNAMGVPDAPEYTIEDNLAFQQFEITYDDALRRAYENRPDIKSIIAKRRAAEANISYAKSGYAPLLSGNASYNWAGKDSTPDNETNGWTIGVTLTVPLFSGFLTSHQVAEAKSNMYVLRANEETLRQQVLFDIQQSFLNLQEAQESISTAELAVKQAQENLDLANGRYAAGVGSPVEVTDAFTAYANARVTYTGALYSYKIAQANIEKAMGVR